MLTPIIGIAFVCNNVVARYAGSIRQNLTFIAYPNNAYNYYVYDKNGVRTGSYTSSNMITETFTMHQETTSDEDATAKTIYQIKLPATEEGYYQLSFMVDFLKDGDDDTTLATITSLQRSVGCMVVHDADYPFGKNTSNLTMTSANSDTKTNGINLEYTDKKLWQADDNYMWKTLAPSLSERVDLTYKINSGDVNKGYVIWAWEFFGLESNAKYTIILTEINIRKLTELETDKPHLDFTQTQYVNNTVDEDANEVSGYTRNAPAKGTYVTSATTDSMTMQLSPLYAGWDNSNKVGYVSKNGAQYQNLVGLNIPIKNVQYDKSYKVSFDFSIARQGKLDVDDDNLTLDDVLYAGGSEADTAREYDTFFSKIEEDNEERTLLLQSYLHSGAVNGRTVAEHEDAKSQIVLNNATYTPYEVTRFDEFKQLTSGSNSAADIFYSSATTINSLTTSNSTANNLKFFNAVRHSEDNGQNRINWFTFYNTTFTFNISSELNADKNLDLDDLYWVWGIDILHPGRWFRIKIDNVRIDEVEQYGSNINKNGIKIAGTQVDNFNYYRSDQTEETYLRGANGTGQNFQALQGTTLSNGQTYPTTSMASINTYGPIYDAGNKVVAIGGHDSSGNSIKGINDYKIYLDGYCVVKGGVEKYVWSADGGKTWHDMIIETSLSDADITTMAYAERRVDQAQKPTYDTHEYFARYPSYFDETLINESVGEDGYRVEEKNGINDHVDFIQTDAVNSMFTGFRMYADISQYANAWDLDIVFAAVPKTNSNARCELIRITNVNQGHLYKSMINEVVSDIKVTKTINTYGDTAESKYANAIKDYVKGTTTWAQSTYKYSFNRMSGIAYTEGVKTDNGYSSLTNPRSIEQMMPLFSGFAIKNKIRIKGWAICAGGTEAYYWSVDGGKTWELCGGSPVSNTAENSILISNAREWMGGRSLTSADVMMCTFSADTAALEIDLSAHVGKVVSLVVASKPRDNAQFCPIAKVNAISVCGDRVFYNKITTLKVDGATLGGLVEYSKLDLNQSSLTIGKVSYSAIEPYNVDLYSARKVTNYAVDVKSGSLIDLNGFALCYGGIKHFQYTLDGGKTWTILDEGNVSKGTQFADANAAILRVAAVIDFDLNSIAGSNGNYASGHSDRTFKFNLPTFSKNGVYDFLLVSVANDGNDTMYPILHMDINVID